MSLPSYHTPIAGQPRRILFARADRLRRSITSRLIRSLARLTRRLESDLYGLRQLVTPGDVCIDVGAAVGLYAAELSHLVGEAGEVYSVEPLDFLYPATPMLGLRRGVNVRCHPVMRSPATTR